MDNAVALVQAYLRINGYFTVAEYPILETHGRNAVQMATDIDILAFRFPGAIRQVSGKRGEKWQQGLSIPDPDLRVPSGAPDMIIGEVKEGRAHLNKSMRNPAIVSAALARFGCCDPEHAERTAQKLLGPPRCETHPGRCLATAAVPGAAPARTTPLSRISRRPPPRAATPPRGQGGGWPGCCFALWIEPL